MANTKKAAKTVEKKAETESKADKFKRLGSARVAKAIKAIGNIGNLGGPNYEKTPEQVEKIASALVNAVTATCERLKASKTKVADKFEL